VHVWTVRDGSSSILFCDLKQLRTVCFSTDGLFVAAGGLDGIRMWELGLGEPLQAFDAHKPWAHSLVFTPEGLMSSIYNKTIEHWDISVLGEYEPIESEDLTRLALDGMGQRKEIQIPSQTFRGYKVFLSTAFLSYAYVLCSTSQSGPYSVAFVFIFIPLRSGVHSVAISQNGRWVLSASKNPNVCIWDAHNAELHCELSRERKDDVVSVDFSPNGGHIATAYDDGGVRVWSCEELHHTITPEVSLNVAS
jgi:WD40 repeat protein